MPCLTRWFRMLVAAVGISCAQAEQIDPLPVFFSDNHAESFTWFSQVLDLDEAATLVLVDHHSDASWAERSDDLREGLRRVASAEQRQERCRAWRQTGRIQAYNWIEPLMPRPFDQVIWLAREHLTNNEASELEQEARDIVDARLEFEQRSAGAMAQRFHVVAADGLEPLQLPARPLAVTIDLDYFMEMEPAARTESFAKIWRWVIGQPHLSALSFCLSRPWLQDEAEAQALMRLAFQAVDGVRGARLTIHGPVDTTPDDSLQALKLKAEHQAIPRWDTAAMPADLRQLFVRHQSDWTFANDTRDWKSIVTKWNESAEPISLAIDRAEIDSDAIYRLPQTTEAILRVRALPAKASGRVRWYELQPLHAAVDLLPATGLGKSFSEHPARWVAEGRSFLGETKDAALPLTGKLASLGRHRFCAEVQLGNDWLPTPVLEIRRLEGTGFHAGLSECFGMPYVFGIALASDAMQQGVDTGWGSDCSNFLVHAWRRAGVPMTWGDPSQVAAQLHPLGRELRANLQLPIRENLNSGIAVSFGNHMAALWEDVEPLGILTGADLFVHHLGGIPEIVPLRQLAETRPTFSVLTLPASPSCEIVFAGDCVLTEATETTIASLRKKCAPADVVLWNLEGVPSQQPLARGVTYDFRFDPAKLSWLQAQGVTAASLANNHAGDAGPSGLTEALEQCRAVSLPTPGAGTLANAVKPLRLTRQGVPLAIFGVSCVPSLTSTKSDPRVACLPNHETELSTEFHRARAAGEVIIVMVHWGQEYEQKVTTEQQHWARWFLQQGASVIVGAHPHVAQRAEISQGGFIAYSLGNAIYPAKLRGLDTGTLLRVKVDAKGRILQQAFEELTAPKK